MSAENFPKNETVEIPDYDGYLKLLASELQNHPAYALAKAAFRGFQFFSAREKAWMQVLAEKGLWDDSASERLYEKTEENASSFDKDLIKRAVRAAAGGDLKVPINGKEVTLTPDTAIGLLQEFLLNDAPSSEGVRMFSQFMSSEGKLRQSYDDFVKKADAHNKQASLSKGQEAAALEARKRALAIYISRCKLAGAPEPTPAEQESMLQGDLQIPGNPQ